MALDVTEELARILDGPCISIRPEDILGDMDGAGKVVVCEGDLPSACSIRGAKVIVVKGEVAGRPDTLSEIFATDRVVVLGSVIRAHVQTKRLMVFGSVQNALLRATYGIEIGDHVTNTQAIMGPSVDRLESLEERQSGLINREPRQKELQQQIENARRSLTRLLNATGVVFNLSIGKIIQQRPEGLLIDLSSLYEAVKGRSEPEVDRALLQFFAKAMVGLLTELNRNYITSGRGHQDRFKKVVLKLRDLVFKTRELDKFTFFHAAEAGEVKALCNQFGLGKPMLAVHGTIEPSFELGIAGVESGGENQVLTVLDYRLQIENGRREGTDEARFYKGQNLKDMVVLSQQSLENVLFYAEGSKIRWKSRS
jgi:hypothetical protein